MVHHHDPPSWPSTLRAVLVGLQLVLGLAPIWYAVRVQRREREEARHREPAPNDALKLLNATCKDVTRVERRARSSVFSHLARIVLAVRSVMPACLDPRTGPVTKTPRVLLSG